MKKKSKQKNIVVIGGGTGTYTVLTGLKQYPVNLTAIVSMADGGGSTKILREEFGILPPGSVRPALIALSNASQTLAELFNFRFNKGSFNGHNFGNLFITALTEQFGSFEKALEEAGKILRIQGQVIPSTLENVRLIAELENGKIVRGETNIDVPKHDGNLRIQKIWLEPEAKGGTILYPPKANPKASSAIKAADLIVIGPGDLFSSIIPNFLAEGMSKALQQAHGKKAYVCNIMTKFGETTGFSAKDFLDTIEKYLGENSIDYILANKTKPSKERVKKYEKEKAEFVEGSLKEFAGRKVKVVRGDFLRKKGFIRHDANKLAKALISLV
ncbi:MAG: putative gluconeoproteinis factor [Parcubacteria group bacterium Greene0714_21]|nr:MAG: putative gluconeoproteinis factor [Parcubacteria group bacterium Greene0416_39]TSD04152.1 MAG: putative gluconeoproteinis factor [Parcubacteria group bacterium Greene0714_21]